MNGQLQAVPEDWSRAMAVVAHPDDLEYGAASAIARWTRAGRSVAYVMITDGEAGIDGLHPLEAGPVRRRRVLDVAAGSGNAAIPAAATGASVVASDLTPELFDAGRRIAAQRGVAPEWVEADAEALPFADASFDVVLSALGRCSRPTTRPPPTS